MTEEICCPYREKVFCDYLCTANMYEPGKFLDTVTGYIMCELDWENCPEYQKAEAKKYKIEQIRANGGSRK